MYNSRIIARAQLRAIWRGSAPQHVNIWPAIRGLGAFCGASDPAAPAIIHLRGDPDAAVWRLDRRKCHGVLDAHHGQHAGAKVERVLLALPDFQGAGVLQRERAEPWPAGGGGCGIAEFQPDKPPLAALVRLRNAAPHCATSAAGEQATVAGHAGAPGVRQAGALQLHRAEDGPAVRERRPGGPEQRPPDGAAAEGLQPQLCVQGEHRGPARGAVEDSAAGMPARRAVAQSGGAGLQQRPGRQNRRVRGAGHGKRQPVLPGESGAPPAAAGRQRARRAGIARKRRRRPRRGAERRGAVRSAGVDAAEERQGKDNAGQAHVGPDLAPRPRGRRHRAAAAQRRPARRPDRADAGPAAAADTGQPGGRAHEGVAARVPALPEAQPAGSGGDRLPAAQARRGLPAHIHQRVQGHRRAVGPAAAAVRRDAQRGAVPGAEVLRQGGDAHTAPDVPRPSQAVQGDQGPPAAVYK